MPWFIDTDQNVNVTGLQDPTTGSYVNNAVVTAVMYEADGETQVTGQTWPLTLSYVSASNGNYRGLLQDTRVLVDGSLYWLWLQVKPSAGGDPIKTWKWSDTARYRTPDDG